MAADQNSLLPVYLANGDDTMKRDRVASRLVARVGKLGDLSFNSDVFDGEHAKGGDIVSSCNTLPFASAVRLVTVRNVDKLRKDDSEQLVSYLGSPCPSTVLALYASSLAKNTRLYKAIAKVGKQAIIDCSSVKARDLPALISAESKRHGVELTRGAIERLIASVGEDTVRIDSELKKLALSHSGTDPVNEAEIDLMVGRTAEVKPWEFVDAFSARNIERCLFCRTHMESVSPHALIAMCVNRLRELIVVRSLLQRGEASAIPKRLGKPDWLVKKYVPWARGFSDDELRGALRSARDTERSMKSGSDPDAAFEYWYVTLITRRSA